MNSFPYCPLSNPSALQMLVGSQTTTPEQQPNGIVQTSSTQQSLQLQQLLLAIGHSGNPLQPHQQHSLFEQNGLRAEGVPSSLDQVLLDQLLVHLQQQQLLLPRPIPVHPFAHLSLAHCPQSLLHLLPQCALPDFRAELLPQSAPSIVHVSHQGQGQSVPRPSSNFASPMATDTASSVGSSSSSTRECEQEEDKKPPQPTTTHRLSYPREFKLIVLRSYWENGQNKYRTCKEFQITKSMLNGWLAKADRIRQSRPGSLKSGRSGRRPQFPKIEQRLFETLQQQMANGERPSNKLIREMARKLAEKDEAEGPEHVVANALSCQFSERWLNNFKRRYRIQDSSDGIMMMGNGEEKMANEDNGERVPSPPSSPSCPTVDNVWQGQEWKSIAREIGTSAGGGQLPIQAFYARFPKVLQGNGVRPNKGNMAAESDD